jgi:beta-1,4-mannosyl-glycoprotein beta-1,4-N-acetylglucosaminyltransferase
MIFDCFTFFNELDLLEIRLNEMSCIVDKFVLVEATSTFTGQKKPLFFNENKSRYGQFSDKIIHIIVEDMSHVNNEFTKKSSAWAREYHQRDQILRGLRFADPNDLILVSDVDEIVSAEKLGRALLERHPGSLSIFTLSNHLYYLNRQSIENPDWVLGPRMIEFKYLTSPQKLRMTRIIGSKRITNPLARNLHTRILNYLKSGIPNPITIHPKGGWHFSSVGSWENYRQKVQAFSHEEIKQHGIYLDESVFQKRVSSGTQTVKIDELPVYIQQNQERFRHIISKFEE